MPASVSLFPRLISADGTFLPPERKIHRLPSTSRAEFVEDSELVLDLISASLHYSHGTIPEEVKDRLYNDCLTCQVSYTAGGREFKRDFYEGLDPTYEEGPVVSFFRPADGFWLVWSYKRRGG